MNLSFRPAYPTPAHENAAQAILHYFRSIPGVAAVLLVNSCARGKATADSCLDMVVLVEPETFKAQGANLETAWQAHHARQPVFAELESVGRYSEVHLDIVDGNYQPKPRETTGGPDTFEIEIGNHIAYSAPLWERGPYFAELKERWLPYYDEQLRVERLATVRWYCLNNLDHIPLYAARGLLFQAYDRLYHSFQEFLQALFIARRTYPIAYDKWIRDQIEGLLDLPDLYAELPAILTMDNLESQELVSRAGRLGQLLESYAPAASTARSGR